MDFWVEVAVGLALFTILVLILQLYFMIRKLSTSFAKLGYVIREDAKKYFDDAAGKIIDTNEQFQTSYSKIVHDGTISALAEAGTTLETTLATAQQEAGEIVMKAREDARRIVLAAHDESEKKSQDALSRSAETIRWVMEQYVNKEYTAEEHKDIIIKLLDEYVDEHRA